MKISNEIQFKNWDELVKYVNNLDGLNIPEDYILKNISLFYQEVTNE